MNGTGFGCSNLGILLPHHEIFRDVVEAAKAGCDLCRLWAATAKDEWQFEGHDLSGKR